MIQCDKNTTTIGPAPTRSVNLYQHATYPGIQALHILDAVISLERGGGPWHRGREILVWTTVLLGLGRNFGRDGERGDQNPPLTFVGRVFVTCAVVRGNRLGGWTGRTGRAGRRNLKLLKKSNIIASTESNIINGVALSSQKPPTSPHFQLLPAAQVGGASSQDPRP